MVFLLCPIEFSVTTVFQQDQTILLEIEIDVNLYHSARSDWTAFQKIISYFNYRNIKKI